MALYQSSKHLLAGTGSDSSIAYEVCQTTLQSHSPHRRHANPNLEDHRSDSGDNSDGNKPGNESETTWDAINEDLKDEQTL
jgi:hypothetical protein